MRPPIWLGDLVTAWNAVGRPAQLDTLLELLDLDVDEPVAARPEELPGTPLPSRPVTKTMFAPFPVAPAADEASSDSPPAARARVRSISITPLPRATTATRPWDHVVPLPPLLEQASQYRHEPLWSHTTCRALLGAATHSIRDAGVVDVARTVQMISERKRIREVPRGEIRTHRAGIQLVVDRTWSMTPFQDDVTALRRQLFTVVGFDLVDEIWFTGDLERCHRPAAPRARRKRADSTSASSRPKPSRPAVVAWRPPPAGVPVVVVSDLGQAAERRGDHGVAEVWARLFSGATDAGCAAIAIVPRRTTERGKGWTAIAWDERTTAGGVLAARARVHG